MSATGRYVVIWASKDEVSWEEIVSLFDNLWTISVGPKAVYGATKINGKMLEDGVMSSDIENLIEMAELYLYDDKNCIRGSTKTPAIFVTGLPLDQLKGRIERILYHE